MINSEPDVKKLQAVSVPLIGDVWESVSHQRTIIDQSDGVYLIRKRQKVSGKATWLYHRREQIEKFARKAELTKRGTESGGSR